MSEISASLRYSSTWSWAVDGHFCEWNVLSWVFLVLIVAVELHWAGEWRLSMKITVSYFVSPRRSSIFVIVTQKLEYGYSYKLSMWSLQIKRDPILEGAVWNNLGLIQLLNLDPWHHIITDFRVSVHCTYSLPSSLGTIEASLGWRNQSFCGKW